MRAVKLRAEKTSQERPIQHLYPLELKCDDVGEGASDPTDLNAAASVARPRRNAPIAANLRIHHAVKAIEAGQL